MSNLSVGDHHLPYCPISMKVIVVPRCPLVEQKIQTRQNHSKRSLSPNGDVQQCQINRL